MKKIILFWLGILIIFLGSIFLILCLIFNGSLILDDFPLQEQWRSKLDGEVTSLSTNGDQIIFARTSKKLYALNSESGEILWNHETAWQGIQKPPIASNGLVYLADGKAIWALVEENGNVKWTREVPLSSASVELISGNAVVVKMSSYIFVLDALDGSILWSTSECRYGDFPVYIDSKTLYSPCVNNITARDINNGKIIWNSQKPLVIAKVAYRDNTMYYSPDRKTLSAIDLQNLGTLWESGITSEGFREFTILGSHLIVTGSDKFSVFERGTGYQIWCSDFNNPQNPVVVGEILFMFNGFQNEITAFDILTGEKIGELSIKNLKMFSVERDLLVSIDDRIIFGNGSSIFSFGK